MIARNRNWIWIWMLMVTGCTTTSGPRVLERSDGLLAPPPWAQLDRSSQATEGRTQFVGFVNVPGESSKSAALNMADEKALSEPMRAMVTAFMDQNQVGEELSSSDQVGQRIISATRKQRPNMASLKITRRYWETRTSVDPVTGAPTYELHAWALAEIDDAEFAKAQRDFLSALRTEPKVRAILDEVGKNQREPEKKEPSKNQTLDEEPHAG